MTTWRMENGTWELELSQPPCNEIGLPMLETLERFLDEVEGSEAHSVIIYSSLPTGFCAGADLKSLYEEVRAGVDSGTLDELRSFLDRIHAVMNRLDMLPQTTIGVIHRVCFGGGFELALTCDVLIAEKTARFAFPELRLGIIPGFGGIPRLKRDVGNAVVRDVLMTGRSINAKRALAIGLVSQVVQPEQGLNVARRMAAQQGKYDADARRTCKQFIKPLPSAALEEEKAHFVRLFQNPPVMAALKKFYESTDIRPYLA